MEFMKFLCCLGCDGVVLRFGYLGSGSACGVVGSESLRFDEVWALFLGWGLIGWVWWFCCSLIHLASVMVGVGSICVGNGGPGVRWRGRILNLLEMRSTLIIFVMFQLISSMFLDSANVRLKLFATGLL